MSRVKQWDYLWDTIGHLLPDEGPSQRSEELRESLQRLYEMPLPKQAIAEIANALLSAYQLGKEQSEL